MQRKKEDNTPIKRMADLLRQGATLTDLACPACASPLFRLHDGTIWCAKDQKKVIIIKEGEEPPQQEAPTNAKSTYDKLETTILTKIQCLQTKIEKTEDPKELQRLSSALTQLLNNLEQIQKVKKE